jgi:hypothetical protein
MQPTKLFCVGGPVDGFEVTYTDETRFEFFRPGQIVEVEGKLVGHGDPQSVYTPRTINGVVAFAVEEGVDTLDAVSYLLNKCYPYHARKSLSATRP